jgi:DnaJ-class molecular chaperone
MFEDFTYITDEAFLENYWWEEQVICPHCQGKGRIYLETENESVPCKFCQGKGIIKRKQEEINYS